MKINKAVFGLILAAILGLAYLGSRVYIDRQLELTEIPVVVRELGARTHITAEDLTWIRIPKAYLPESVVLDKESLIGQYVRIDTAIPQGSFVYASMVETLENAKDYPSLLLHDGQVVYALEVDLKSTSGNTLQPFQKVDLYVSLTNNRLTYVDRLIGNVRILSLKDKNGKDLQKATDIPRLMLVALDQKLVPILTKAIELGDLIITPVSRTDPDKESFLVENTKLLKVLYER